MNSLSSKPKKNTHKRESSDFFSHFNNGMKSGLENEIEELLSYRKQLVKKIEEIVAFKLNIRDLYIIGILLRSKSLIDGFIGLVNQNNFVCAISLIRLHLDSLLRLYAPNISKLCFYEFADKVIVEGIAIRDLKSKFRNQKDNDDLCLTDTLLAKKLNELPNFLWVRKLYYAGNGFVHFSDKHVFASLKTMDNNMVQIASNNSDFIPETEKNGAIGGMIKITRGIISMTDEWIENRNKM